MTIVHIASTEVSSINEVDLARPGRAVASIDRAPGAGSPLPRPLPDTKDTGRISFGASCRILRSGM